MRVASTVLRSAIVLALVMLVASCGNGSSRYAKYQDKDAAIRKIDAVLATVSPYPGAHVSSHQTFAGSYHVAPNDFIEAEPYSGDFYYAIPQPVGAAVIRRYFLRVLPGAGWRCHAGKRMLGSQLTFGCTRGRGTIGAAVSDQGYELQIGIGQERPPIKTIPGD